MTETYEILLNRYRVDDYIEGWIVGIIDIATGVPDEPTYVYSANGSVATMRFDATEE